MPIEIEKTPLDGVLVIKPRVFGDARGFFYESFNAREFAAATGVATPFVQDNHSRSAQGVLRGIHYQIDQAQGKLVRVVAGSVYDVAVDLRRRSATFGQWFGIELSADNQTQLWIPPGFGHAFAVTSEGAEFLYKTTDYWYPASEHTIAWNDPEIGIDWPVDGAPKVSEKDAAGLSLSRAKVFE